MNLPTMVAKMCYYAQSILSDDNEPGNIEPMMVCTSHAVACFLAQNTKHGEDGVETNVALKELCKLPAKNEHEWEVVIDGFADVYGGWNSA